MHTSGFNNNRWSDSYLVRPSNLEARWFGEGASTTAHLTQGWPGIVWSCDRADGFIILIKPRLVVQSWSAGLHPEAIAACASCGGGHH